MVFLFSLIIALAVLFLYLSMKRSGELGSRGSILAGVGGLFGLIALMQCFTVVPAGNVGVVDFFGVVSQNTLKSGINFINPFAWDYKVFSKNSRVERVNGCSIARRFDCSIRG